MSIREIRKNAFEKYRNHRLNSWILSIICGLFIAALLLIGILSELFYLLLIPFVVLPFLFSCFVNHASLSQKDELTAGGLFRGYGLFFSRPYINSFSGVRSFFKTLLVELAVSGAVLGICYAVYSQSETFAVTVNEIIEQVTHNTITSETLQALLDANDYELSHYINLTNSITFLCGAFAFILFILRESITIYIRLHIRNVPLAHQIARTAIKGNYKKFNKAFFALNWPLLLILIAGMTGGVILSIYAFDNYALSGVLGLCVGTAAMFAFLPFFFANNEAIYEALALDIASIGEQYVQDVIKKYGVEVETPKQEEVEGNKKDPDNTGPNE